MAAGSLSALFPEGVSHDEPGLQALRSGAARMYYRARQLAEVLDRLLADRRASSGG